MLIKLAWRNLWRNRRRTLITAASIFFAVLLAIVMRAMQEGSYERMIANYVAYAGHVQVQEPEYQERRHIDYSFDPAAQFVSEVQKDQKIRAVIRRLENVGLVSRDPGRGQTSTIESKVCMIVGTELDKENQINDLKDKLIAGRIPNPDEEGVLIGEKLAQKIELNYQSDSLTGTFKSDSVILLASGYHGNYATGRYAVAGILKFGNPDLSKRMLYMPLPLAQKFNVAPEQVTSLNVLYQDNDAAQNRYHLLKEEMPEELKAITWQKLSPELDQMIRGDRAGGILQMGVLYLVIAFGIFGTVLMMLRERAYEFGVMVAIGMKKLRLSVMIFFETLFIAALGVLAGSIVAIPIVWYFQEFPIRLGGEMAEISEQYGMEPIMPTILEPSIFLNQALLVFIISVVVFIYPLIHILRLDPIGSMRQ